MIELRNQFILAPLKLGYGDSTGTVNERHLDFYNIRSKFIGAVTPEPLYLDKGLRELPSQIGIDNDEKLTGLKTLTDLLHKNGAKAIAHLNHPGRLANPKIPGNYFISSTDKPCPNGGATPVKMNRDMMNEVVDMFVDRAKRAVTAGFDIIELQAGHGYLLAQFISPDVNDREDEYGGSFENRIKFPLEVIEAVRGAIDIPIIVRISGDEMIPSGFHIDEMLKFSKILEHKGVDAIHVSAGSACTTPPWFFQHMFIPKGKTWELAGKIKEAVKIPVVFVGRIHSEADINFLKSNYNADFIALGRAMVADHNFLAKYFNEIEGNIRPCLACAEGCLGGVKGGKGLGCVVNPTVNTGLPEIEKSDKQKHFAVVGGGLAGMQTAAALSERGYEVDLFEKNELGGQFNLASLPPNKSSLEELVTYFKNEISGSSVNLIKREALADDFADSGYDGIVMATGAVPSVPPIKGLDKYYWTEFLDDNLLPQNKKVLVIGGGLIGLEVASKLVDAGNEVIIVEMLSEIARGMEMIEKALTVKKLKAKSTTIYTNCRVTEVAGTEVLIESESEKKKISGVDEIVVATGMQSFLPFDYTGDIPLYFVGDAKQVGKAQKAIHDAYELALKL